MLHKTLLWQIYVSGNIETYLCLREKFSMFLSDLTIFGVSRHITIKGPTVKFYGKHSSGSLAGKRRETDNKRDTTKLIRVFHDYTVAPNEVQRMWSN